MYGKKSKPCRVFKYGCLSPLTNELEINDEMFRRNKYWNKLVEIERLYRQKYLLITLVPGDIEAAHIQAEIGIWQKEIKAKRQQNRTSDVDVSNLKEKIKKAKAELKKLWEKNKAERKVLIKLKKSELVKAEQERRELQKEARKKSGLHWCNYDDVEKSYEVARKEAMKKGKYLRFHRFDGTGKLSVRFKDGIPVQDVFAEGSNRLFYIAPVDLGAWNDPVRANRRKLSQTTVKIRVQSDEKRKPVWSEFPMVMHRPLPYDGEIRGASIVCEKVGKKYRYSLDVTVAFSDNYIKERKEHGREALITRPSVGINIGWRLKDNDELRIAYWVDETGNHGELKLDSYTVSQFQKINDLRSIRDVHFDSVKDALKQFITKNTVPYWLKESTKTLHKWRSTERMVNLISNWHDNRFAGDAGIINILEQWRKRENHLYNWESNLRDQIIKRRREIYRLFAKKISQKYGQIFIEDFDISNVAKHLEPEDGPQLSIPPRRQRVIAATSILRDVIENAVKKEGLAYTKSDAKYITLECHLCGYTEDWAAANSIERKCPNCKEVWDQDYNAAFLNLSRNIGAKPLVLNTFM